MSDLADVDTDAMLTERPRGVKRPTGSALELGEGERMVKRERDGVLALFLKRHTRRGLKTIRNAHVELL